MKAILMISCVLGMVMASTAWAAEGNEPIRSVKLGANREFVVNGKPFFPIMSWAQDSRRYPLLRSVGINTFTGGDDDAAANLKAAQAAGGYHVSHFTKDAIGHPVLLGWIHSDEPDLPTNRQDIEVTAEAMGSYNLRRLGQMFDGNDDSRATLEPLEGLEITARWPKEVTVVSFRIRLGDSPVMIKDIELSGDGRLLAKATLTRSTEAQMIPLAQPATFKALTVRIPTVHPGEGAEGTCYELEGLDAAGDNVLAVPVRREPRLFPDAVMKTYREVRAADPSRPVLMTLTAGFMKVDTRHPEAIKKLYPQYVTATDAVGFDFYPIYGYNKPEWITRPGEGVGELVELAGPTKPVYAWIETSKGSRWITYSKQHDVLPKHTRAEVWMSIIKGATAIGYFTHAWRPEFTEFAPTKEMQAELTRLNGQITRLTEPILAPPAKAKIAMAMSDDVPGHFKATDSGGAIWIFAQNIDAKDRGATAAFRVEGLAAGTAIEVVDENRTIKAGDGEFSDAFDALAEHIYRIAR